MGAGSAREEGAGWKYGRWEDRGDGGDTRGYTREESCTRAHIWYRTPSRFSIGMSASPSAVTFPAGRSGSSMFLKVDCTTLAYLHRATGHIHRKRTVQRKTSREQLRANLMDDPKCIIIACRGEMQAGGGGGSRRRREKKEKLCFQPRSIKIHPPLRRRRRRRKEREENFYF